MTKMQFQKLVFAALIQSFTSDFKMIPAELKISRTRKETCFPNLKLIENEPEIFSAPCFAS